MRMPIIWPVKYVGVLVCKALPTQKLVLVTPVFAGLGVSDQTSMKSTNTLRTVPSQECDMWCHASSLSDGKLVAPISLPSPYQ